MAKRPREDGSTGAIKNAGGSKGPQSPKGPAGRLALFAILASFLIYLIPLFNPHGGFNFWPPAFLSGILEGAPVALAVAVGVLVLQALCALLFAWILSRSGPFRLLLAALSLPLLFFLVNFSLLYAIPAAVLLEYDPSRDIGQLEEVCRISNRTIVHVDSGVSLKLEQAGEAWVIGEDLKSWGLLTMPGCRVLPVVQVDKPLQLTYALPGARALFAGYDGGVFLFTGNPPNLEPLEPPAWIKYWHPILTRDGNALAWLERAREGGGEGPPPHVIKRRALTAEGETRELILEQATDKSLTLLDAYEGGAMLYAYPNIFLEVDEGGLLVWGPIEPEGLASPRFNFRRLGPEGWLAWDGYREEGRARVIWSLPSGEGSLDVPRGRSIEALALSPDGAYIAYSTEGNSYFSVEGRLILLDVRTGEVVFRRRLKPFSRVGLAMLTSRFLAVQSFDEGERAIIVYKLPTN